MTPQLLPILSLIFAACFWGIVWYPLRLLNDAGIGGAWQVMTCYSAAILLLVVAFRPPMEGLLNQPGRLVLMAITAGWTNLGFVLAMLDGTVVRALLLFYLSPVWTILLGHYWLKERITPISMWTVPVALIGMVLMVWEPGLKWIWPPQTSDLLALTAGMAFAVTNVLTRELQYLGTRQKTLASWLGVIVLSLAFVLLFDPQVPQVEWQPWIGAVALGLFGFFGTTLAVIYGISRMPVQRSAVILLIEILVGGLTAWWIVGETMDGDEWIGGTMILIAGFVAAVWGQGGEADAIPVASVAEPDQLRDLHDE
ncbi:MAG: DMT family transporter [bacterium]